MCKVPFFPDGAAGRKMAPCGASQRLTGAWRISMMCARTRFFGGLYRAAARAHIRRRSAYPEAL